MPDGPRRRSGSLQYYSSQWCCTSWTVAPQRWHSMHRGLDDPVRGGLDDAKGELGSDIGEDERLAYALVNKTTAAQSLSRILSIRQWLDITAGDRKVRSRGCSCSEKILGSHTTESV